MSEAVNLEVAAEVVTVENAPEIANEKVPEVEKILAHAKQFQVASAETYEFALLGVKRCIEGIDRVDSLFGEARDAANRAHKAITGAMGKLQGPLKEAKDIYGRKAYAFDQAERKRKEAEERARQEAERKRLEDEQVRKARFLEMAGATAEADRTIEETPEVVPQEIETLAKPDGTSSRENWTFEVVNAAEVPREYLMVDLVKIGRVVKALKAETRIAGIRIFDKGSIVARRG